jgi:hypothetical protein
VAAPDCEPLRANGGRLESFMRAAWTGGFAGRLEAPKPVGERPASVTFPCAAQVCCPLPARCEAMLPVAALEDCEEFGIAEGGRFWDRFRCPGDVADVFGVLADRPFIAGESCAGAFDVPVC